MTRAALLAAGSDPFLNAYWLRHFRTWASEVDELHVAVCGPLAPDVLAYTEGCISDVGGTMHHIPKRTAHGVVIEYLVAQTTADYLMLCEDDAFIRRPAAVAEAFASLEAGSVDVVGCGRDSYATEEVLMAAKAKFGDGPLAFWPCFLFVSRAQLLATDGDFDSTMWAAGERVAALDHICASPNEADTFISASWQLRAAGLRIDLRDNHRVVEPIKGIWPDSPWFHVGSLSSGYGYNFLGPDIPAQRESEIAAFRSVMDDAHKRMAWWQRAWDCWDGGIPAEHDRYEGGFREFMAEVGMDQAAVNASRESFDRLVTWAER